MYVLKTHKEMYVNTTNYMITYVSTLMQQGVQCSHVLQDAYYSESERLC